MENKSNSQLKHTFYRAIELVLLIWALILVFIIVRYFFFNPSTNKPTSAAESENDSPLATVQLLPSRSDVQNNKTNEPTMAPSNTIIPTWTFPASPSPLPSPVTIIYKPTATSTPLPTQTFTPTPLPTVNWLSNPTLVAINVTPSITTVTAIPTRVATAEVPDKVINILLLGSDKRGNSPSWLTDVIIVVSINTEGPSVAMLSIPRDLYVWVPDWTMSKINTVDAHGNAINYPGGGPGLLKQTLLYNLGIPVHYYARVDFVGFQRIVDTIGGIDVPVTCQMTDWRLKSPELDIEDEDNWELYTIEQKVQHMDGDLALWYVRSRKSSTDFDRSRRQHQVLRAMLSKGLAADIIPQIPQLWSDLSETVETDLTLGEILQLALVAPQLDFNNIKSRFIAGDAVLSWTTPDKNQYTLLPQFEAIEEIIADFFEPPSQNRAFQDPPVVEIWNGTTRPDIEYLAADNLNWEGLIPVIGQPDRNDYAETIVTFYGTSFKGANTWSITKLFGIYESQIIHQPDPDSTVDYRVILGNNFNPCVHRVLGAMQAPTPSPTPEENPASN
ncbi:MAG: LCP family protein [Anaerolineales bacterium]|nr:LCP family protein [Anaerolineales bacterium]